MLATPLCCGEISTELPSCWGPLSCNQIVSLRVQILLLMCFMLCKNKCIGRIQPYYIYSGFWLDTIFSCIYYNNCSTPYFCCTQGRGSVVGIATCYGLDCPGIESRWVQEIFRTRPDRPWAPPSLLHNGCRVFPGGTAAGAWL